MTVHRMPSRFRLLAWLAALAIGAAPGGCGSSRDDRFVLLRRGPRAPDSPTALFYPARDDAGAARVRRLMSDAFAGELLRTLAMTRRLVDATAGRDSVRRARAATPTYLALGISDLFQNQPYRARQIGSGWWRESVPDGAPLVWIDDDPLHAELGRALDRQRGARATGDPESLRDAVALEQIVEGLGRAIADLVAPPPEGGPGRPQASDPLRDGYVLFLDVVGAEWRPTGESAAIANAVRDARAELRRAEWFAAVRANQGILRSPCTHELCERHEPDADEIAQDPTVIATFLYRLAASPAGRRLASDDLYRPFVPEAPPAGISPGRLLGSFRSFQAKLLACWDRARRDGRPPRDLVDLVEAYAGAYPEERPDVTRIFLVTTYGRTARPGGIDHRLPPQEVESRLAALTAEILFGRSSLRAGMRLTPPAAVRRL
ncbi:MAG TPA: hypothetical protein VFH68_22550 [Polyangia bacterium]|nr:hypothetical protein [Polyangia bacterium]